MKQNGYDPIIMIIVAVKIVLTSNDRKKLPLLKYSHNIRIKHKRFLNYTTVLLAYSGEQNVLK